MENKLLKMPFLLLLMVLCTHILPAQKKLWYYPVKPGTDQWKQFQSNEEMVEACQIPNDVLKTLSTDELLDICLNYPLLFDVFAFNNLNDGFGKFENDFNGFRDLIGRKDAFSKLLLKYDSKKIKDMPQNTEQHAKGRFAFSFSFMELFLSHPVIAMNCKNKREAVGILWEKNKEKKKEPEWYKNFGLTTYYLAITNLIEQDDLSGGANRAFNPKVKAYALGMAMLTPEEQAQLDNDINTYLNQ